MTKKIKTVFSNSQLAHVWAQQKQASGRSGSMFFEDNKIYSYGFHYLAGVIHTVKGKRVALVRSDTYSNTTSKHLSDIRNALEGLMPVFLVKNVDDLKLASKELDACANNSISSSLKTIKVTAKSTISARIEYINEMYEAASLFRSLIGKKRIEPNESDLAEVLGHLEKRLARYKELNSPEMIAKKQAKADAKVLKEQAEAISKFRAGDHFPHFKLSTELLRVKNTVVQTSRGAEVPLNAAKMLLKALVSKTDVVGQTIGNFTVETVTRLESDTIVKIGCHKIALSEAIKVLGEVA